MNFATVAEGQNYLDMAYVLIKSILHQNPWFNYPFHIFHITPLSDYDIDDFNLLYPGVEFHRIDIDAYPPAKRYPKFLSFEAFLLPGKTVFIDADMLCLGSLEGIDTFEDEGLLMVREKRRDTFNAGFMIINENMKSNDNYLGLLDTDYGHVDYFGNDQKSINLYFKDRITYMEQRWNVLITELDDLPLARVVFLHMIHKPHFFKEHDATYADLFKLWDEYGVKIGGTRGRE
jgi:lipopolysaccharide biosynthesis glycosyltransferase